SAARETAIPVVEDYVLAEWASEQATLAANVYKRPEELSRFAEIVRAYGGDTGDLPIAFSAEGWMSFPEITKWANTHDHVLLIDDFEVRYDREGKKLKLEDGVLAVSHDRSTVHILSSCSSRFLSRLVC
ncbi:MAG TPA: hypothetical protein VE844_09230, partial [Gammaproteobacteria bacterium]|nr:hypothetical protein [Gammaproteobacteria bacterium]